jgi:hypothetical protein
MTDLALPIQRLVKVRLAKDEGLWATWNFHDGLTTRFGELNWQLDNKQLVEQLANNPCLFERLVGQMWDEMTFIAWKDGEFGILYEVEYMSCESEAREGGTQFDGALMPHEEVIAGLLRALEKLAQAFPEVTFAVPSEEEVIYGRPAAWAFAPDGALLDFEHRKALSDAMYRLDSPTDAQARMSMAPG